MIIEKLKQEEQDTLERINTLQMYLEKAKEKHTKIQEDIEYYRKEYHKDIDVTYFPSWKVLKEKKRLESKFDLVLLDVMFREKYPFRSFVEVRKYIREGFIPVCFTDEKKSGKKLIMIKDTDRTMKALDKTFFVGYADQGE